MHSFVRYMSAAVATAAISFTAGAAAAQDARPSGQAGEMQTEAIREHVQEAEDLVQSLLEWRHITTWKDGGDGETPPPAGPKSTLISIAGADVQQLSGLIDALVAQVPKAATRSSQPRGDLRAHAEKAQEIARELSPPQAESTAAAAHAKGGLVTIDRTSLQRLEIELDAMEMLLPRTLNARQ